MNIQRLPKIPNRPKKSDREKAIALAEVLHGKKCRWNHTDGCSWYYSNWDNPCSTRQKYLTDAYNMLAENDNDIIKAILKYL